MRRKPKIRKKSNRLIGAIICVLVVAICFVFFVRSRELKEQNADTNQQIEALQNEIAEEEERTKRLEEYAKYVNTKQYVEEMAREKLGLIYPGELIFKAE